MPEQPTSTFFQRLYGLYQLQEIDSSLDELNETHGDLPNAVNEARTQYNAVAEKIARFEKEAEDAINQRALITAQLAEFIERERKYKEQQYTVKTNRQYDALTRELESVQTQITQLRASFKPLEETEATARETGKSLAPELETLKENLDVCELELEESKQTTNDEEARLLDQRRTMLKLVTDEDVAMYEKIRTARNGHAIALVRRDSCSGCFNMVPPQKSVELRQFAAIITCENCGRILVPEELLQKNHVE